MKNILILCFSCVESGENCLLGFCGSREAPVHKRLKNESDVCHGLLIVGQLNSGKHRRCAINANNHPPLELLHLLWADKLSFDRTYTRDESSKSGCEHATLTLHQLRWSSTLSIDKAIIFTLRFLNSSLSLAARASSVVHTGVKSLGWENRIPHLQRKTHTPRGHEEFVPPITLELSSPHSRCLFKNDLRYIFSDKVSHCVYVFCSN